MDTNSNLYELDPRFSRTIGWITSSELQKIQSIKVGIAGAGGVGGQYAEALARLGVQNFRIYDPDVFELVNFNRQNASGMSSLGKNKVDTIKQRILDINPKANVEIKKEYLSEKNISDFTSDLDIYLDGLDFFAFKARLILFKALADKNIPAITVAPVGMGASLLFFSSTGMSFANYFGINENLSDSENSFRFLVGLTPTLMQRAYNVDSSRVDFAEHRVPSTPIGIYLSAGVAATALIQIILNRGPIRAAPWSYHYDSYLIQLKKRYTFWGYKNPLQQLKLMFMRALYK